VKRHSQKIVFSLIKIAQAYVLVKKDSLLNLDSLSISEVLFIKDQNMEVFVNEDTQIRFNAFYDLISLLEERQVTPTEIELENIQNLRQNSVKIYIIISSNQEYQEISM
jgi:hypothetical protein